MSYLDALRSEAEAVVAALVSSNSRYTVDNQQPEYRGGTNQILFGGCDGALIVYKYFVTPERWRNEAASLRHFAPTGLVPAILLEKDERLLVTTRLTGRDLFAAMPSLNLEQVSRLSRRVGEALSALCAVNARPLVDTFIIYVWGGDMAALLRHYLARSRLVQQDAPTYQSPIFEQSLALLEAEVDMIGSQPTMLYHEDLSNMCVDENGVTGFYDLEMARIGTIFLQLGQALSLCGQKRLKWPDIAAGYSKKSGRGINERDLQSILAMSHFYHWIRICRGGRWSEQHNDEACRAVEDDAAWYENEFRRLNAILGLATVFGE